MKTKDVVVNGKTFKIWKMNLGFKADYQNATTKVELINENGKLKRDVQIDGSKIIMMAIVYGVYSSDDYNIPPPKDIGLGLSPEELNQRVRIVRQFDFDATELYEEINKFNVSEEPEVLKK